MAIKIKQVSKSEDHSTKILVYGPSGVGKTRLSATLESPLILSAEAGLLSIADTGLDYIEIKTLKDLDDAYDFLISSNDAKKYKSVALDSVSEIAEIMLTEYKEATKDPRQAYGNLADDLTVLIRKFRGFDNYDVYFTAKQLRITDDYTNITSYVPSMPGKNLVASIPYLFDEVFAMRIGVLEDGTEYSYLQTKRDIQYEAKDRSGKLNKIEKPDLSHIINKIKGG